MLVHGISLSLQSRRHRTIVRVVAARGRGCLLLLLLGGLPLLGFAATESAGQSAHRRVRSRVGPSVAGNRTADRSKSRAARRIPDCLTLP